MAEVQIKKMRITHEMILNWLVLNPDKTQGQCAEFFGVSQSWLSVIVNSDVFQVRWAERRMLMDGRVGQLAESKLRGVVDKGLERLDTIIKASDDPRLILDTTDKLLGRLGYGPKTAGVQINNNTQANTYVINRAVLAAAREQISDAGKQIVEGVEVREVKELEAPKEEQGWASSIKPHIEDPDGKVGAVEYPDEPQPAELGPKSEAFFNGLKVPKL